MTTRDLLKRTPFRLAAAFTTLFLITAVIFSAFLYVRLGAELASQIRNRVEETSDALVAIDLTKGYDELASVIESESTSIRDDDTIFQLVDKSGNFRAGNVRGLPVKDGWMSLTRESLVFVSDSSESCFSSGNRVTANIAILIATRAIVITGARLDFSRSSPSKTEKKSN